MSSSESPKSSLSFALDDDDGSLFGVEDDGLIQRLDFTDSEAENEINDLNSSNSCDFDKYSSPISKPANTYRMRFNLVDSASSPSELNPREYMTRSPPKHNSIFKKRLNYDGAAAKPWIDTTPPYKKVRALRLFESPQSPKTLLKQSELRSTDKGKQLIAEIISTPVHYDKNHNVRNRRSVFSIPKFSSPILQTNINPFNTSEELICSTGKRRRNDSGFLQASFNDSLDAHNESELREFHPNKRLHIRDSTPTRYEQEFQEICQIGAGEFGSVYKCVHRIDGCVYAIKKSRRPLKGTCDERTALNEVYAHAVLGHHKHIVRYYSAWAEDDHHMLIQNEYCNGGSLAQVIEQQSLQNKRIPESEVKHVLIHIAQGLRYIHSLQLAHMDIKPGNIFIVTKKRLLPITPPSSDDGFGDDEFDEDDVIYKIGDLGHVTLLSNPEVEEGDCRYLPAELLKDDYSDLAKADIFALGLTIYEVCGGGPLPKNGEEWHSIREGNLPYMSYYSKELNDLIRKMIHPDPKERPTSAALVQNQTLVPYVCKTKEQLNRELNEEKYKNQLLSRQLEMAKVYSTCKFMDIDDCEFKKNFALKECNVDKFESKISNELTSKENVVDKKKKFVAKPRSCTRLMGKGTARSNSSTF